MGKLRVIKAGALSTIQDEGRFGYRQYGIPQSGAMDLMAVHDANYLVGNDLNFPVIESAIQGLELKVLKDTTIGIAGAEVNIQINNQEAHMHLSYQLKVGDVLSISAPKQGVYSYLGIGGILDAKNDFGSTSTYLTAGFGGIEGRALKAGDIIESKDETQFKSRSVENPGLRKMGNIQTIRIVKGPEWKMLKDLPNRKVFHVDASSNRMGIRLKGNSLGIDGKEIVSSAVIPGTIQLPGDGCPIILMNDCQTTGGYPRIGKVIDEDLGILAQTKPGEKVRFSIVEI